jgi:hypothetical protein
MASDPPTTPRELGLLYISLLEAKKTKELLSLFTPDAIIESPVYGATLASKFYDKLFEDTNSSQIVVHGIFEESATKRLVVYFNYTWVLANKELVFFDVIDVMDYNEELKISKIVIIYDAGKARERIKYLHMNPNTRV